MPMNGFCGKTEVINCMEIEAANNRGIERSKLKSARRKSISISILVALQFTLLVIFLNTNFACVFPYYFIIS